ncbi:MULTISPECIES: hypothetical protein [Actinoplanes]|nr:MULTISPECIES: hypothetical protein [Actinoplanes]
MTDRAGSTKRRLASTTVRDGPTTDWAGRLPTVVFDAAGSCRTV